MAFNPQLIRLARFQVETSYHSAYQCLSIRGVLAERWGHGPIFEAFNDQGMQIALLPSRAIPLAT
jgi:hypothetical protein